MTLFQHTLKVLLSGQKSETSHLALPHADGEHIVGREMIQYPMGNKAVMRGTPHGWRLKWQVGREYSIQPKRGEKSIGKYRLLDIWWQDVRTLTVEQIKAEGFRDHWNHNARISFLLVWIGMHDKNFIGQFERHPMTLHLDSRPNELYGAWRMKIQVCWDSVDWNAPSVTALHIPQYRLE